MTLAEARAEVESWFNLERLVGNYYQSATGEPYVVITSGGEKGEGEHVPALCSTPEVAIRLWLDAVRIYAGAPDQSKTLYWRAVPELDEGYVLGIKHEGDVSFSTELRAALTHKVYFVYARLLVSDRPQIQPAILSECAA